MNENQNRNNSATESLLIATHLDIQGLDPERGLVPSVFISCASNEFKEVRVAIADKFRESVVECITPIEDIVLEFSDQVSPNTTPELPSRIQERFRQHCGAILDKLAKEICRSEIVVHLVGRSVGFRVLPCCEVVENVIQAACKWRSDHKHPRIPDFSREFLSKLTYTQWEALLAILYGKKLFVYISASAGLKIDENPGDGKADDDQYLQQCHLSWLIQTTHDVGIPIDFNIPNLLWDRVNNDVLELLTEAKSTFKKRLREKAVERFLSKFDKVEPVVETERELRQRKIDKNRFYGREWLFDNVRNWLTDGQEGTLWLQADAGFGKSRFSSELVIRSIRPDSIQVYAIVFLDPTVGTLEVFTKLCAQLRDRCPYFNADFDSVWSKFDWEGLMSEFQWTSEFSPTSDEEIDLIERLTLPLLIEPLQKQVARHEGLDSLIIFDGLDEILQYEGGKETSPLKHFLRSIVGAKLTNFRLLFTSRPAHKYKLLESLIDTKGPRRVKLPQGKLEEDAKEFIERELGEFDPGWRDAFCIQRVIFKSKSSMLYLNYLRQDIKDRDLSPIDVESMPHGMANYYLAKLDQYYPGEKYMEFQQTVKKVLAVIAAGEQTDLSVSDIQSICGHEAVEILRHTTRTMMVIVERPKTIDKEHIAVFAPFHLSFMDWLLGRSFDEGDDGDKDDKLEQESRLSHRFRVHIEEGDRIIARWAAAKFECEQFEVPDPRRYWIRQGSNHLLKTIQHLLQNQLAEQAGVEPERFVFLRQVVDFLGWLKSDRKVPQAQAIVGRDMPMLSAMLALSIKDENKLTDKILKLMEPVDQDKLFNLVKDICSTDITDRVIQWIGRTQYDPVSWNKIVEEALGLEWVVRYAVSGGQAARYRRLCSDSNGNAQDRQRAVDEIEALLYSDRINSVEMGCNAVGEIAIFPGELKNRGKPNLIRWLERISTFKHHFCGPVIGDILICFTLRGEHDVVEKLVKAKIADTFWKPIWQYTRQDVIRVLSHRRLEGQSLQRDLSEFELEVLLAVETLNNRNKRIDAFITELQAEVTEKAGELHSRNKNTDEFLDEANLLVKNLAKLLQKPNLDDDDQLTIQDWLTRRYVDVNRRVETAVKFLQLLMTHTWWRVCEKGSSILAELQARTNDHDLCLQILDRLVLSLKSLPGECWRAIYGASEAAYLCRHFDDGMEVGPKTYTRLQYCIKNFFNHPNSDVRGLLAENVSFLVEQPEEGQVLGKKGHRINFPEDYKDEIDFWLLDTDIWVLEHMYSMFVAILKMEKNGFGIETWIGERANHIKAHPECLLANFAKLDLDWMKMKKEDFLTRLEAIQQNSPYRPS